jgi:hypothetical protein
MKRATSFILLVSVVVMAVCSFFAIHQDSGIFSPTLITIGCLSPMPDGTGCHTLSDLAEMMNFHVDAFKGLLLTIITLTAITLHLLVSHKRITDQLIRAVFATRQTVVAHSIAQYHTSQYFQKNLSWLHFATHAPSATR